MWSEQDRSKLKTLMRNKRTFYDAWECFAIKTQTQTRTQHIFLLHIRLLCMQQIAMFSCKKIAQVSHQKFTFLLNVYKMLTSVYSNTTMTVVTPMQLLLYDCFV